MPYSKGKGGGAFVGYKQKVKTLLRNIFTKITKNDTTIELNFSFHQQLATRHLSHRWMRIREMRHLHLDAGNLHAEIAKIENQSIQITALIHRFRLLILHSLTLA